MDLAVGFVMFVLALALGTGLERKRRGRPFGLRGMLRVAGYGLLAMLAVAGFAVAAWMGFAGAVGFAVAVCLIEGTSRDSLGELNARSMPQGNVESRPDQGLFD